MRQRPYSSTGRKQNALPNRDIIRMFEGLKVAESFLLKNNVREFLFRKARKRSEARRKPVTHDGDELWLDPSSRS